MHQPWRSFAAIINKCLSGKTTALESLRLSRAQILWGMYHNKYVDYVYLLCHCRLLMAKEYVTTKEKNKMFWHTARDDSMFTTTIVISKHQDIQIYGVILPQHLTNQAILESEAYKTYHAYATGEKIPKPKYVKNKDDLKNQSSKKKSAQTSKGKRLKISTKVAKPAKKKQPATTSKAKGLNVLSAVALSETKQMKLGTKKSKTQFHSSHASGSGADEGTDNDDETNMSENDDDQNDDNADNEGDNDQDDDNEQTESNNDEMTSLISRANDEKERMDEEETNEEEEANELYRDVNVNLEGRDTTMMETDIRKGTKNQSPKHQNHHGMEKRRQAKVKVNQNRVKVLEDDFSEFKQTNLFDEAVSSISDIINQYLANKMNKAVKTAVQLQSHRLRDEAQAKNKDFINTLDENMRKIIKNQVKEQKTLYKALVNAYETDKDILETYGDTVTFKRHQDDKDEDEEPLRWIKPGSTSNSAQAEEPIHADKNLEEPAHQEFDIGFTKDQPVDETTHTLARNEDPRESFNELTDDTPLRTSHIRDESFGSNQISNERHHIQHTPTPKASYIRIKNKKNKLMRIDELHKFSDSTLDDVWSALDDILKRIRLEYLPQTVWRNVDRERAGAMIQAINSPIDRNKRLLRSLGKFVGGRLYGGDLRLL
ncbi:hypothetical protein Tco_1175726 [Tanacetum coccineum]